MSILEFMQLFNVWKQIKDNRKQLHGFEPGNDHPFLIFSMGWAVENIRCS